MVRGIHVASIPLRAKSREASNNGSGGARTPSPIRMAAVLVVLLTSKAIVFELAGSRDSSVSGSRSTGSDSDPGWTLTKRVSVSTYKNVGGLAAVAPFLPDGEPTSAKGDAIVALPGRQKGHVQIIRLKLGINGSVSASMPGKRPTGQSASTGASTIIVAHESSIASLALSPCGRLLSTASSKGTLLRIWSTVVDSNHGTIASQQLSAHGAKVRAAGRTGFGAMLVRELRRGTDPARILSTVFALDGSLLATASDKGTVHIFDIADLIYGMTGAGGGGSDGMAGGAAASSSGSTGSSKAKGLSSGAAKLFPSGLGQLASHIPPSLLPQYFRSEWSSAQFRVPLQTFGASWRDPRLDSAFFGGSEEAEEEQRRKVGSAKSTDGAWAAMKGRLGDIRKGEPGVDERVFLCWVRTGEGKMNGGRDRSGLRLIVITTSGAWYKLALTTGGSDAGEEEDKTSGSTVLDMYREDARQTSASSRRGIGCRLEEYRQFSERGDGWEY